MNRQKRLLYCYGCREFNDLAQVRKWSHDGRNLSPGLCVVSILSSCDQSEFGERRWFTEDGNDERICLLDFSDGGLTDESEIDLFDFSRPDRDHLYIDKAADGLYNPMSAGQAAYLARFLDLNVKKGMNIMVHCSAGASRSQGVVRYVLDMYPHINWSTRPDNPCLTPNMHVVRMLKRAYYCLPTVIMSPQRYTDN